MNFRPDGEGLARILATLPDFVLMVDEEGAVRYINRVEEGYRRDEVIGTPASEFLFPESREAFAAALEAALRTREAQEFDVEAEMADGSRKWYRSRMLPLAENGEARGVVLVAADVTELKAAEEEAARYRRLLPICSWCDRIETEGGEWTTVEAYLRKATETTVSHGMCPECYERHVEKHGEGGANSGGSVA